MFDFTKNKPLPDFGLFGVHKKFTRISVQLTSLCNNNCIFCSIPSSLQEKGTMSLADMEILLAAVSNFDGEVMLSLNGEAFLLEDLPERIALTRKYWPKCKIELISTFNIDRGPGHIKALFAAGLDSLQISCYGYTREDYREVHGYDGFKGLERNMAYLEAVPGIEGKDIRLYSFADAGSAFGVTEEELKQKTFLDLAISRHVKTRVIRQVHSWQGRNASSPPTLAGCPFPCSAVWGNKARHLNVSWKLDVLPCCYFHGHEYSFGNLREHPLPVIFTSKPYIDFYHKQWTRDLDDFPLCHSCVTLRESGNPSELQRLAAYEGQGLAGREVYFWGAGAAYRAYGIFFSQAKPRAILLDHTDTLPARIDNIPVTHPDAVLLTGKILPLVIFANPPHAGAILAKIQKQYPDYPLNKMVLCPARIHCWQDASTAGA